jgi:hypothetical protein
MMKKIAAFIVLGLALIASPAVALNSSSIPTKFPIPWGQSAGTSYIIYPTPTTSQIGIQNCAASLNDGFPPLTFQSATLGGCGPLGANYNGILKQITLWNQWQSAGGPVFYDSAFSAAIGGYPKWAALSNASTPGCFWISTVDGNTTDPDTGGANWSGVCPGGGAGGTSTGSANSQVITATPYVVKAGAQICWTPGFTNTGPLQINVNGAGLVNVYQVTQGGAIALVGGEVHLSTIACAQYDGTQYDLETFATAASLVNQDQPLSGGANVTSYSLGAGSGGGTVTLDCGKAPLQYIANNGNFTFAAPSNDGSCMVLITNGGAAGTVSFSGFTTNANTGEPLTTTNTSKFIITIVRINSVSTWLSKALQ